MKKTLCLFSNNSFRYAHLRFAQMSLLEPRSSTRNKCVRAKMSNGLRMPYSSYLFLNTLCLHHNSYYRLSVCGRYDKEGCQLSVFVISVALRRRYLTRQYQSQWILKDFLRGQRQKQKIANLGVSRIQRKGHRPGT